MKKVLLLLGMLSLSFVGFAQVSKQQAIQIVMDSVVGSDATNVNVYMESLSQTNPYYVMSPYDSIHSPFASYWLFFIDDMPEYMWYHDCRYVFLNCTNGLFSIFQGYLPPLSINTTMTEVSSAFDDVTVTSFGNSYHLATPIANVNDGKYAVLLCTDNINYDVFWRALSHMYCALIEQGYPKSNIFVLSYDGTTATNYSLDLDNDSENDIMENKPCNRQNIESVFSSLEESMRFGDILHVFVISHAGHDPFSNNLEFSLWNQQKFSSADFADMFSNLNCSEITINIQSCYSGGFTNDLKSSFSQSTKYALLSSTDAYHQYSYPILYVEMTGMDPYSLLSCSAFRGGYPDPIEPWHIAYNIGNYPYFETLFGMNNHEINYDLVGGNNNGIHEIGEVIKFCSFDYQFDSLLAANNYNCGFVEDLLSLRGITGNVTNSQTISGSFHIEDNFRVTNNAALELDTDSKLFLFNANLYVNEGSTLILGDGTSIVARSGNCHVYVSGDIEFGDGVSFIAEDGSTLEVSFLNTTSQQIVDSVRFTNCSISSSSTSDISLRNCLFSNCQVNPTGDFSANYCSFTESSIVANTPSYVISKTALVSNCNFSNLNHIGVSLTNYMNYEVSNNHISANGFPGIYVFMCGRYVQATALISNNIVTGCSTGIQAYSSRGTLSGNQIFGNGTGLRFDNISNMSVCGSTTGNGQRIADNSGIEVYVSGNSFPSLFEYNRIVDEDNSGNPNDPLLLYDLSAGSDNASMVFDIEHNYWGTSFNPTEDLNPYSLFDYDPVWDGRSANSPERQLYEDAETALSAGRQEAADSLYRFIITSYPNSSYAQAAMKQLMYAENLLQNGYDNLKGFYNHITDTALLILADHLSNKCDEMLENWSNAISWYENVLINPASYEDSVYAVIDLGNLYLEMDSTKGCMGKMQQYRPISKKQHYEKALALLSTLPKLKKSPFFDFAPITNLSANYHNDSILLTWDFPTTYQPVRETLSWSGDMFSQSGSYLQPDIYEDNAHRYDSLDLRSFVGWKIKSIGIIPVDSHVIYYASVWVNEGQEFVQIYQDPLVDTVLFEENLHELNQSIIIEAGKEYLIGYRVLCDPSLPYWSGYYNAIDAGPGNGKGNMNNNYFLGWEPYPPMYNWCINTIIESPEGEVLTLSQNDEETLTGYKVYKDGQLIEEIGRRFQTYSFDNGYSIGETVTYSVTAMYGDAESEPVSVTFAYDGVNDSSDTGNVTVSPNPTNGLVLIDGMNVAELRVCNILGQTLKTIRNSNTFSVSGLPAGLYLLRITDGEGATVTRRIVVK